MDSFDTDTAIKGALEYLKANGIVIDERDPLVGPQITDRLRVLGWEWELYPEGTGYRAAATKRINNVMADTVVERAATSAGALILLLGQVYKRQAEGIVPE